MSSTFNLLTVGRFSALRLSGRLVSGSGSGDFFCGSSLLASPSSKSDSRRHLSQRSWNVVRYHQDLKQAIEFAPKADLPVINRPNDLLVQVLASSVNPLDIAMSRGYGNVMLTLSNMIMSTGIERLSWDRLPLTLGRDFVGQIVARGNGVNCFKPGDIVWGTVPPYQNGSHADYVVTSDNAISLKPKRVSNIEAASLPYVGLTAWSALSTFGELTPSNAINKNVLVLGGSGGVGCFAIQLLKYWGANVVTTCSGDSIEWLKSFTNVDECIDYRQTEHYLRQYSGTFDFILDASSASASHKNYEILSSIVDQQQRQSNPAGSTGSSSSSKSVFDKKRTMYVTLTSPLLHNFDRRGVMSGLACTISDAISDSLNGLQHGLSYRWAYYLPNPKALSYIADLVDRGAIKPFAINVYRFDQALEAYESLHNRPVNGKVVLSNGSQSSLGQ